MGAKDVSQPSQPQTCTCKCSCSRDGHCTVLPFSCPGVGVDRNQCCQSASPRGFWPERGPPGRKIQAQGLWDEFKKTGEQSMYFGASADTKRTLIQRWSKTLGGSDCLGQGKGGGPVGRVNVEKTVGLDRFVRQHGQGLDASLGLRPRRA